MHILHIHVFLHSAQMCDVLGITAERRVTYIKAKRVSVSGSALRTKHFTEGLRDKVEKVIKMSVYQSSDFAEKAI